MIINAQFFMLESCLSQSITHSGEKYIKSLGIFRIISVNGYQGMYLFCRRLWYNLKNAVHRGCLRAAAAMRLLQEKLKADVRFA